MYRLNVPAGNLFPGQWFLRRHNVFAAWEHVAGGSASLPVGILSTGGFGAALPEFAGKTTSKWDVVANSATIAQGTFDYVGTWLAAVAVGVGGTDVVRGVAYGSPLAYVRFGDIYNEFTPARVAAAVQKARALGARALAFDVGASSLPPDAALSAEFAAHVSAGGLVFGSSTQWSGIASAVDDENVLLCGGLYLTDESYGAQTQWTGGEGSRNGAAVDFVGLASPAYRLPDPFGRPYGAFTASSTTLNQGPIAAIAAAIANLVWSMNPALTSAEVKAILRASVDRPRPSNEWQFSRYYTNPAAGCIDAERAVLQAKATLPANAGVVFPYLRLRGDGFVATEDRFAFAERNLEYVFDGAGSLRVVPSGRISLELGGFCSSGPVTEVELWIDGERVYKGRPRPDTDPLWLTEHRQKLWDLRVVARTASGQVATRTCLTDLAPGTYTALREVTFGGTLTAATTKLSDGSVLLHGDRPPQAVTVTCATATVAAVEEPTADSWQALVTGVAPGSYHLVTVSDGTDSLTVTVQGAIEEHVAEVVSLSEARAEQLAAKELRSEAPGPTEGHGTTFAAQEPRQEAVAMVDAKVEAMVPERRLRLDGRPLRLMVGTGSGFREVVLKVSDGSAYR